MDAVVIKLIFALFFSFTISWYLIPLLKKIAFTFKFIDVPDGKVKTHERPVAYLGGLAVYGGFIATLALVLPFENQLNSLFVGSTILLFIGLLDDLVPLRPLQKFTGQLIAALCFLKAGFYLKEQFFFTWWHIPLSLLWMLTIINAFNLIDVMDGLATLVAINCAAGFLILAWLYHLNAVVIVLGALLGALLSFFLVNKPPATMYLGDAGSLFIGGILGAIPFLFPWSYYNSLGLLSPMILLALPLIEIAGLIVIRTAKKIPFYRPSRDHFCHILRRRGLSVKQVLLCVQLFSLYQLAVVVAWTFKPLPWWWIGIHAVLFLSLWIGALSTQLYRSILPY